MSLRLTLNGGTAEEPRLQEGSGSRREAPLAPLDALEDLIVDVEDIVTT